MANNPLLANPLVGVLRPAVWQVCNDHAVDVFDVGTACLLLMDARGMQTGAQGHAHPLWPTTSCQGLGRPPFSLLWGFMLAFTARPREVIPQKVEPPPEPEPVKEPEPVPVPATSTKGPVKSPPCTGHSVDNAQAAPTGPTPRPGAAGRDDDDDPDDVEAWYVTTCPCRRVLRVMLELFR